MIRKKTHYTTSNVPYYSSQEIPNGEYNKHYMRVSDIEKKAYDAVAKNKADSFDSECLRLSLAQAKKIEDPIKVYGRYLVAEEHGLYSIAKGFLNKYRLLTQTRAERIATLLKEL